MDIVCIAMIVILVVLIIVWKLVGSSSYRTPPPMQYPSMAPPPTPGQLKHEREVSMGREKIKCPHCGTRFEEREEKCPSCGYR